MTRFVESTITFPYKRSLGPVVGAFMTALTEKRILGIRSSDTVLVPPMEWDPATGAELAHDFVEVGPSGTVESWTWVPTPSVQHPLPHPFAFAFIRLDGATTPLLHAVDAGAPERMSEGYGWHPAGEARASAASMTSSASSPARHPRPTGDDTGAAQEPVETHGLHRVDHLPEPRAGGRRPRRCAASREQRLLGLRCPTCERVYAGGRGYCPVDALELGPECEVDLPHIGTITNFTIVTPVQYPGQTETEPFVRAFVLLDDTDVVIPYSPVIDLPADEVRVGKRVDAVWASPAEEQDEEGGMGGAWGSLVGWIPIGEPDVDRPDLVNRIF